MRSESLKLSIQPEYHDQLNDMYYFFLGCLQKDKKTEKKGIKLEKRRRGEKTSCGKTKGQAGPSKVVQEVLADLKSGQKV